MQATMPLYKRVISDGEYDVVTQWSGKENFNKFITEEVLKVITSVVGADATRNVREYGLTSIHKFISPNFRIEIQDKLSEAIKIPMLRITYEFAREALGLGDDFYMDVMVISRVHFPFEVAVKSDMTYLDYSAKRGRTSFKVAPELTTSYHKNLPFPAWAHGPHADSWFGHSFDGINLWWGVDGVTEESGMTFYPDYVGDNSIPVHEEPPYLAKDFPLPKPVFFNIDPGDVIVFNSDTLHGTRVHTADVTRISLSTRINPSRPRFNEEKFRHVKLWLRTQDLDDFVQASKLEKLPTIEDSHKLDIHGGVGKTVESLMFAAPKEDPGNEDGVHGNSCKKKLDLNLRRIEVQLDDGVTSVNVGPSNILATGEKVLMKLGRHQIVLARTSAGLRALSAICPHVGYNLAAGSHDDEKVFCNGHGLAFSWNDGRSQCASFNARRYQVEETSEGIVVHL
jgi:nitrite reductase/ring-hydroxylating ferredoxin subunit